MTVQILGAGCPKCRMLEEQARLALAETDIDAEIVKITDIDTIMEMGVMMTPALAIDGKVVSSGKVLKKDQIIPMLQEAE
ncbi:thioredoxin family protein [Marispirochaeta aestuarii]|uniref:thioredoxin family protein n=1 Tax=Marispirochaeta aestuarii TaxID=1963862 RepID=UPI0029C8DD64|nr:thioredoxin family protein [Marispirochaeta aestuarii]